MHLTQGGIWTKWCSQTCAPVISLVISSICLTASQFLVDEARQRYPSAIKFHFNAESKGIDFSAQQVGDDVKADEWYHMHDMSPQPWNPK